MKKIKLTIERFYDGKYLVEYETKPSNFISSAEYKKKICVDDAELIKTIKTLMEE
jgi:hypothetical protein